MQSAIKHALNNSDRRLLNRIELELIRELGIRPTTGCKRTAYAIGQHGRQLLVLWRDADALDCKECDGTGILYAEGRSRTYEMECPNCGGEGIDENSEADPDAIVITDIDGQIVSDIAVEDFPWDDYAYFDPLKNYEKQQINVSKTTESTT
ncbi:hypothetical protein ACO0LB_10115 [Undibacterium sp. SXout7W]|uniref:hypothetical protein n=1 Tax=Undibacterium sp. SXout7W TaxID=3413049 RepID=UPI003BF203D0